MGLQKKRQELEEAVTSFLTTRKNNLHENTAFAKTSYVYLYPAIATSAQALKLKLIP